MNAKEIDELATHLVGEFSAQKDDDVRDKDIIRQKHVIEAQKDRKLQVKLEHPLGAGGFSAAVPNVGQRPVHLRD